MACERRLRGLRTAEVPLKAGALVASHTHAKYGCATQGAHHTHALPALPAPSRTMENQAEESKEPALHSMGHFTQLWVIFFP